MQRRKGQATLWLVRNDLQLVYDTVVTVFDELLQGCSQFTLKGAVTRKATADLLHQRLGCVWVSAQLERLGASDRQHGGFVIGASFLSAHDGVDPALRPHSGTTTGGSLAGSRLPACGRNSSV